MPLRDVVYWLEGRLKQLFRFRFRGLGGMLKKSRYARGETVFLGRKLQYADAPSFLFMHNEIFKKEIYKFAAVSPRPYIIDCGANIGLSVIYFKHLYPDAEVVAFEPDKNIFALLEKNIGSFGLKGVILVNKAVWKEAGTLDFFAEGADGGRLAQPSDGRQLVPVQALRLYDYLDRPVDFLKIDIEGAEFEVLQDCQSRLGNAKNIFVEYHSFADQPQRLGELLNLLKNCGFRYYIDKVGIVSRQPFLKREASLNMDLQLNIYFYKG